MFDVKRFDVYRKVKRGIPENVCCSGLSACVGANVGVCHKQRGNVLFLVTKRPNTTNNYWCSDLNSINMLYSISFNFRSPGIYARNIIQKLFSHCDFVSHLVGFEF